MLRALLRWAPQNSPGLEEARLICKNHLVPLYAGAGFQVVGPSAVVHGADPWTEMRCALEAGA